MYVKVSNKFPNILLVVGNGKDVGALMLLDELTDMDEPPIGNKVAGSVCVILDPGKDGHGCILGKFGNWLGPNVGESHPEAEVGAGPSLK